MLRKLFQTRPELKSPRELGLMREAGKVVAVALRICRELALPGVKTIEIDRAVEDHYRRHNALPPVLPREMIESGARELHHTAARENPDAISRHDGADPRHWP